MKIRSTEFENNGEIPKKYTCDGEDINPPLIIEDVPDNAVNLVLIMTDPDAPGGKFDHWIVWNINPSTSLIEKNTVPEDAMEGINDFNRVSYGGPCPPSGEHRYYFKLYALDNKLDINYSSTKAQVEEAMKDSIIEEAQLVGLYERE